MDAELDILETYNALSSNSKTAFQFTRCVDECESKHWDLYYNKCFDIFSKLWSFQSKHRGILEKKIGFSRKDVGDIANKIGQLYYHYYLRTSDKIHLKEAFSFLDAIRQRKYYNSSEELKPELRLKHLRCCARLLMIALISSNRRVVLDVLKELETVINKLKVDFIDQKKDSRISLTTIQHIHQWTKLLLDIKLFVHGLGYHNDYHIHLNVLMSFPKLELLSKHSHGSLHISKAVIINSEILQPQFDCFTLDSFRIFTTLDRLKSCPDSESCGLTFPQKKVLNKPSCLDALLTITQMAKDLDVPIIRKRDLAHIGCQHVLLLYLTGSIRENQFASVKEAEKNHAINTRFHITNGKTVKQQQIQLQINHLSQHENLLRPDSIDLVDFEFVGAKTTEAMRNYIYEREMMRDSTISPPPAKKSRVSESFLKAEDLFPVLRKPFFLIVDGGLVEDFTTISAKFNRPLLCLFGPSQYPSKFKEIFPWNGNLLTSFLHRPALGLYLSCGMQMDSIDLANGNLIDELVDQEAKWAEEALHLIRICDDGLWNLIKEDQLMKNFVARFVFAYHALKIHRDFINQKMLPKMIPDVTRMLDDHIVKSSTLTKILEKIVQLLNLRDFFCFIDDMTFK